MNDFSYFPPPTMQKGTWKAKEEHWQGKGMRTWARDADVFYYVTFGYLLHFILLTCYFFILAIKIPMDMYGNTVITNYLFVNIE